MEDMTTVKESKMISKAEQLRHENYGKYNGMWLVAVAIFFGDNTAHLRMSLVDDIDESISTVNADTILSKKLLANEYAAVIKSVQNTHDAVTFKVTEVVSKPIFSRDVKKAIKQQKERILGRESESPLERMIEYTATALFTDLVFDARE